MSSFLEKNQKALDDFNKEANLNLIIKKDDDMLNSTACEAIQIISGIEIKANVSNGTLWMLTAKHVTNGKEIKFCLNTFIYKCREKIINHINNIKLIAENLSNVDFGLMEENIVIATISKE